jgi:hypothetical protein
MKDLIVLAADKDAEFAMRGILARHQSLGIREIVWAVFVHPDRDPGCLLRSPEFLRIFLKQYEHALVLFDHEGCGREDLFGAQIETELGARLAASGWHDRASAIVIEPELELWVWSTSPHVDRVLGWSGHEPALRPWLMAEKLLGSAESKPPRPKEAMRAALRAVQKSPSSALFGELANTVALNRCTDRSFSKLVGDLRRWFAL